MEAEQPTLTTITDSSHDRSYFILTPQLVWALCTDPYELTLWTVIKMVAGEHGTCFLETTQLAALAMMSVGKCHQCRRTLITKHLINGSLHREPGYPQPVWHLSIPDVWMHNLTWRLKHNSLLERVEYKRNQKKSIHRMKTMQRLSPSEKGLSPDEKGSPPDERKKIHEEDPQVEQGIFSLWQVILNELRMQMTRITFEIWIQPLRLLAISHEPPASATILCPTAYIHEWVSNRLDVPLRRTIAGITGHPVSDFSIIYQMDKQPDEAPTS